MATADRIEDAVFLVGILAAGRDELLLAGEALTELFGPASLGSAIWLFDNTGYYRDELGENPLRAFLAYPGLFDTERLSACKLATNALEQKLAAMIGGSLVRPVNLDPGYVTLAKLVLASAKNYAHRIHVGSRIFAEVTLQFRQGRWQTLPWTFPDYASGRYDAFFSQLRSQLPRRSRAVETH